jgi:rhodanese-related sulfurtransferase
MDISVKELKERLSSGASFHFLDVRRDDEYEEQNLGATHIPLQELPDRLDEIADWKNEEILVMCRSGNRSGQAQRFLQSQGFSQVRNVLGGILAWNDLD